MLTNEKCKLEIRKIKIGKSKVSKSVNSEYDVLEFFEPSIKINVWLFFAHS